MRIRLGYACLTKSLDVTASSIMTYTEYLKNKDMIKLDNIIKSNLKDLATIIDYNLANNIYFYRLTSKLIPLATKEEVEFDYIKPYKKYYDKLKSKLKGIRIDVHPDQFTVLNSTKKEVVEASIKNLEYHYNILDALGIKDKIILLHIGSSVLGKVNSIKRFINNFYKLPKYLQDCIAIENDDKVFTIDDCIYISKKINIPIVLDYHHFICNNINPNIEDFLVDIASSWENRCYPIKMHFSSPKSKLKKEFRSHHEYINYQDFICFLEKLKFLNKDIDIMLEAKGKDEALFRLIRQLKLYSDYTFINNDICLK